MTIDFGIGHEEALDLVNSLTPRQRQVAELIAMGMPRRDIAAQLKIAMPTLAIHITGACKRLGVETIVGVGRIWFSAKVGR